MPLPHFNGQATAPAPEAPGGWGAFLRERMKARGLSVRGLALTLGVSPQMVQKWRGGAVPGLNHAPALCEALDVTERQLVRAFERATPVARGGRAS